MQLAILAGGLGTRLSGSIPAGLPKPLAPIAGRPFLDHLLDWAIGQGVDDIVLLTGHGAAAIGDHIGDLYRGTAVSYSVEPTALGTGGALVNARTLLADEFVLVNGDTFVDADLVALRWGLGSSPVVMGLVEVADTGRFGRVEVTDGVVTGFHEKGATGPGLINAGVYALRRSVLDRLPDGASSFERDFLEPRLAEVAPHYLRCGPTFFDIGVPADYLAADQHFSEVRS
ncbi:sugar phosphate nucleotidyltransferase [uncultured Leifsonia sp.]|uniref:sugar phosphate nucleotidyltransferase n=1 Tax=uncultured Leifsonia sp. TaxID=340359 RepID=UPI0025D30339|nr:sugar phosphate nucleotidyltransferase [uncultured Leifsonia sp.]